MDYRTKVNKVFSVDFTDFKKALKATSSKIYLEEVQFKLSHYHIKDIVAEKEIKKEDIKEGLIYYNDKWYPLIEGRFTNDCTALRVNVVHTGGEWGFEPIHFIAIKQELTGTKEEVIKRLLRQKEIWAKSTDYWWLSLPSTKIDYEHSFKYGLSIQSIYYDVRNIIERVFQNYFWASGTDNNARSWCETLLRYDLIEYLNKQEYDTSNLPYTEIIEYDRYEGDRFEGIKVNYEPLVDQIINHTLKYEAIR